MKIKTSELIGPALDWAVAKCEAEDEQHLRELTEPSNCYAPSTLWDQGGPIIEREGITVAKDPVAWVAYFRDRLFDDGIDGWHQHGPTPLTAAMRCYVASKLGDEIEIPEGVER